MQKMDSFEEFALRYPTPGCVKFAQYVIQNCHVGFMFQFEKENLMII